MDGPLHPAPVKHTPDQSRPDSPCVFAMAAPLASPETATAALTPVSFIGFAAFMPPHEDRVSDAVFHPNAARAPPSFV
jgi:hypothetical protein